MTPPLFRHQHRVTYGECTLGNHVYYARYLDLLETARAEFFRQLGATFLEWQQQDVVFPVIECHLHYRAPARYDDVLDIEVWLTEVSRVKLSFQYRITTCDQREILHASTLHVCTSVDEKVKRLPDSLRQSLEKYVRP